MLVTAWYDHSLCINFFHLLARKPNLEKKKLFIQSNSFVIFTCPNPVLLDLGFGQLGQRKDCDHSKSTRASCSTSITAINLNSKSSFENFFSSIFSKNIYIFIVNILFKNIFLIFFLHWNYFQSCFVRG